jgi:hypothetical protein
MSDGSNILQRCEEVSGAESAEPPPSHGNAVLNPHRTCHPRVR